MGKTVEIHETPGSNAHRSNSRNHSSLNTGGNNNHNSDSNPPNFSVASEGRIVELRSRLDSVVTLSRSFSTRVMHRVGMARSRSQDEGAARIVTRAVATRNMGLARDMALARDIEVTRDVEVARDMDVTRQVINSVTSQAAKNVTIEADVTKPVTRKARRRIVVEDEQEKEEDEDEIKEVFLEVEEDLADNGGSALQTADSQIRDGPNEEMRVEAEDRISHLSLGDVEGHVSRRMRFRSVALRRSSCRKHEVKMKRNSEETVVTLRRSSNSAMRRQENRLTRISLSIVSLFVACHVWRLLPTVYEVGSVWISPFYHFGGVDMGYDWINHTHVDPLLGTDEQMDRLLNELSARGIKAILGFIPNHTSSKSPWFLDSEKGIDPYTDYYIWRPSLGVDGSGQQIPPNSWESSVPGQSAWTYSEVRGEFYLHNFLPEQPDLNLENTEVQHDLELILRFWLEKPAVYGFRISGFHILFEDFDDLDHVSSDRNKTAAFFRELRRIGSEYSDKDGIQRLWMLDMGGVSEEEHQWQDIYRNETMNEAIIPFSFGSLPWGDLLTGDDINYAVLEYEDAIPQDERDYIWACWEMGNHDMVTAAGKGFSRIPPNLTQTVMMMSLMLPGSAIVYYGDEIGMFNEDPISCEQTQDPYAKINCTDFAVGSRDQARTPMQWNSSSLNAGFSSSTTGTWLPVSSDYKDTNVEDEKLQLHSDLTLFKRLMYLRGDNPIYEGDKYFPYHNKDVFSFLRKADDSDMGYLVVVNIHGSSDVAINFADVMPGFPLEGRVIASTSLQGQDPHHPEEYVIKH
ncbi:unnamed protein product [Sphagnum tenellum]